MVFPFGNWIISILEIWDNDENFIRLANGSNLNQWKTLVQFQYSMRQSELFEELIQMGIKAGDLIKVGEYEFIWEE